jgi:hypothetical protein
MTEQLDYEPSVHMLSPHVVTGKSKIVLTPWPEYTSDQHILLKSEALLTICEPTDEIRKAYLKKMKLTEEDLMPKPNRVILSEEEQVPELPEDEYEPTYVEEA